MKRALQLFIMVLITNSALAQDFTDLYGDYLGQVPPGDTPVVFAPGIISKPSLEHSAAVFSSDGNEVYWCSVVQARPKNKKKIWYMKRINNRWTAPRDLDLFGDSATIDLDHPFISFNDDRLYFHSERNKVPKEGVSSKQWTRYLNHDIWFVNRLDDKWGKPQNLSAIVNDDNLQSQATVAVNGTVYYLSYLNGVKQKCGIFRSKYIDGEYTTPESLPQTINSTSQDWTPFIAHDESYILFSSRRDNPSDGGDLYISYHDVVKDIWSQPLNLGAPINTWAQERFPTVSPDGKYLFFTRWTQDNNQDVFWVKSDIIEDLKINAEF